MNPNALYERGRFVRLTVFIPRKEETHPDPRLYVEQRVYEGVNEKILIHELLFDGQLKLGFEYVFPGCGDEDVRFGKRDLRLSIQSVSTYDDCSTATNKNKLRVKYANIATNQAGTTIFRPLYHKLCTILRLQPHRIRFG